MLAKMAEVIQKERIYPDISEEKSRHDCQNENTKKESNAFRLGACSKILEKMEKNLEIDTNNRNKKLKKHSRLRTINTLSTVGSTVLSVSGAGVSGTGFGVFVGAPLIGVGALLGVTSLVAIRLDKETIKKLTIYEKLISLGQSKISCIYEMESKALSYEKISAEEFKKINDERDEYDSKRNEILKVPKNGGTLKRSQSVKELTEEVSKAFQKFMTSRALTK